MKSGHPERRRLPAYWYDSWQLYFRKTRGLRAARRVALARLSGALLGAPLALLRSRPSPLALHFFGDFRRHAMTPLFRSPERPASQVLSEADDADPFRRNPGTQNGNPTGIGFWALVAEDFHTNDRDWLSQGFWTLFWHRFGNWRMSVRPKLLRAPLSLLYRLMFKLCEWVCGMMLPYTVRVGRRVRLDHFGGMILVAQQIGDDVIIRQNTTFGIAGLDALHDRPVIGNRVEIGAGAVIAGPIQVGDDAIIGANAVVTRDVPPGAIVGGVPAKLIRMREGAPL